MTFNLNNPESRVEEYLSVIAQIREQYPAIPESRVEAYLEYIIENGGGGGGADPAARAMIAQNYSTTESYSAGDFAVYSNKLYKATEETSGTFDPSKWAETSIDAELKQAKTVWGNISGDLEDQEDLTEALGTAETKATWGHIDGTLSEQTDLNSALQTKASLVNGRIPIQQMPEFVVADVVEVETYEDLPATGETNTLYHVILTDSTYRWVGNHYLLISQQSNFYSLLIDTNIATMGALKDAVDSVNDGGDHVFFDLHQLVNEGYVCTVHFWDETVDGTVHHYCEINDILNDRLYGIKQEWTSDQLVSAYCSSQGLMYDVKKVSLDGTALANDRGFVEIPIAGDSTLGVVRVRSTDGIIINSEGRIIINRATDAQIRAKTATTMPIVPANLQLAVDVGVQGSTNYTSYACEMSDGTTKTLKLYSELV